MILAAFIVGVSEDAVSRRPVRRGFRTAVPASRTHRHGPGSVLGGYVDRAAGDQAGQPARAGPTQHADDRRTDGAGLQRHAAAAGLLRLPRTPLQRSQVLPDTRENVPAPATIQGREEYCQLPPATRPLPPGVKLLGRRIPQQQCKLLAQ